MDEKRFKEKKSSRDRRTITMGYKGLEKKKGERKKEKKKKVDPRITFI